MHAEEAEDVNHRIKVFIRCPLAGFSVSHSHCTAWKTVLLEQRRLWTKIRHEALAPLAYLFGKALFALIQPCDKYQNSEDRCNNAQGMKFNQCRPLEP